MATYGRQCQVCHRIPDARLAFNCRTCSQELLYLPRLDLAKALLLKESLSKDVEKTARDSQNGQPQDSPSDEPYGNTTGNLLCESARSQYRLIAARTQIILDDSRSMQEEIEKMRTQLADMNASLARRKRSLNAASQEIRYEEETSVKLLQENIKSIDSTWGRLHERVSHDRHILPKELASLYGLQIRKRRKGSSSHDEFVLAGIPIYNIKELNNAAPEQLNASTCHVAHLIHLASHYLGLRLPAEISLATAGQPVTYIYPLMSSYKAAALSFGHQQSSTNKFTSRKRMLWVDRPLPQLALEDPQAYSLYLDAVILLAWDVAWLAKTQGIDVGSSKGWEDICLVGKNLWSLFAKTSAEQSSVAGVQTFSQSSAHDFLNSAESTGAEYMKTWKYSTPNKIIEVIKSALAHERMGADWEVLEKPDS